MDVDALVPLAVAMRELAERNAAISMATYKALRDRLLEELGDESDIAFLMPADLRRDGAGNARSGPQVIGAAAAYVRTLASAGSVRQGRLTATTDLMEQAEQLFADQQVTVIAPIMIAGAALEEALRDLVEISESSVPGNPSINAYGQALRSEGHISADDLKEINSLAATRNQAAHGRTDELSRDRAGLFVDRVNLFLRQLQERD